MSDREKLTKWLLDLYLQEWEDAYSPQTYINELLYLHRHGVKGLESYTTEELQRFVDEKQQEIAESCDESL